jgi:hypothetical protein
LQSSHSGVSIADAQYMKCAKTLVHKLLLVEYLNWIQSELHIG